MPKTKKWVYSAKRKASTRRARLVHQAAVKLGMRQLRKLKGREFKEAISDNS